MNKSLRHTLIALSCSSTLLLAGCASQGPSISYVDPNSVDTTTIGFGSTDLQTITQKMVDSMLSSPRIVQITSKSTPILMIAGMKNDTDQFIDTQSITNAISTRLIDSGKFNFVDMSQEANIKKQLEFQHHSGLVNPQEAVAIGQQVGAQYMLYGDISSIHQRNSDQQSLFFQVTMKLLDIKSGMIVWQGEKQIRKVASRKTFGW